MFGLAGEVKETPPKIKSVIFDHNGVFVEDVWEHLYLDENESLMKRLELPKDELKSFGDSLTKEFSLIRATNQVTWQDLEQQYWGRFISHFQGRIDESITTSDLIDYSQGFIRATKHAGMIPLLQELRNEGIHLGLCTNNTEFWFQRQMQALDLTPFFSPESIVLSCHTGEFKSNPSGKMFGLALQAVESTGAETVYVDDRTSNLSKAEKAGIKNTILFENDSPDAAAKLRARLVELGVLKEA